MTAIRLSQRAEQDLARLTEFLLADQPAAALETFDLIASALGILGDHPQIGRPVEQGLRELVISRGRSGYLALYDYDPVKDRVYVLAIRHQRELGYLQ